MIERTFAQIDLYMAAQAKRDEQNIMTCAECFGEMSSEMTMALDEIGVTIDLANNRVTTRNRHALSKAKALCVDYNSGHPLIALDALHDSIRDR